MSFWRKDPPELSEPDERGQRTVIKGGMWEHQLAWWELDNYLRILAAGYGAGKTIQLCKWIIAASLYNAPAWNAIVSPNFPLARRTILPTIRNLLAGKALLRRDFSWSENKGDHCFNFRVEGFPPATLLYLSGDQPDNLKGPNLGAVAIDEPFIQEKAVLLQMMARTRDPQAKLHAIGATGTPEDLNWGYDISEGEEKDNFDVGIVHADTRANLALRAGYADTLIKSYDEKAAAAYVSGKFVSLSTGQVYHAFNKDLHVQTRSLEGIHFAGMDFNVNPMSFVIGCHNGTHVHIYAEYELPNSDTAYACSVIREKHPQVRLVYPDPSCRQRRTNATGGVTDYALIQQSGLTPLAPLAPWPLRDSYNAVNAKLAKGQLTVNPRCVKLIRYLSDYAHEKKKKQEAMSHLLDGARYPITYLFPVWKPSTAQPQVIGA